MTNPKEVSEPNTTVIIKVKHTLDTSNKSAADSTIVFTCPLNEVKGLQEYFKDQL